MMGMQIAAPIIGGMQQASAARAQGDAQAQAYLYNAQVGEYNAQAALQASQADARQQHRANALRHGKLVSQIIGQGVDMDFGTPILIIEEDIKQGELEKNKILHGGRMEAYQQRSQATLNRYYAAQAEAAGKNQAKAARTQGLLGGLRGITGLFGGGM